MSKKNTNQYYLNGTGTSTVQDNVQTGVAKTQGVLLTGLDMAQSLLNRGSAQGSQALQQAKRTSNRQVALCRTAFNLASHRRRGRC